VSFIANPSEVSRSGVEIARDFRDNLIIDRYDPVFADMRASKIKHLRSANSEDAVSWNVFRTLRQIAPVHWLPRLWARAFPDSEQPNLRNVTVHLWVSVSPPPGLLLLGDEGESEIDILIEAPDWVWFIEAKYGSDISLGTTTRPDRDQLLRNIDVGSYYAGVRPFYCSLLSISEQRSPQGAAMVRRYADFALLRERLHGHRPDGLPNLKAIGSIVWSDLADVLSAAHELAERHDEKEYAKRAVEWLAGKGIVRHGV
jgi:hypothetical protein